MGALAPKKDSANKERSHSGSPIGHARKVHNRIEPCWLHIGLPAAQARGEGGDCLATLG